MMVRTYLELNRLQTLEERYEYLRLDGKVGAETFGAERYLNQIFYTTPEWKKIRRDVIVRDNGCEMGLQGYEIAGRIYVHHIDPITMDDILNRSPKLFDLNNLVCVSFDFHQAIHYGCAPRKDKYEIVERSPNDTCPWKH